MFLDPHAFATGFKPAPKRWLTAATGEMPVLEARAPIRPANCEALTFARSAVSASVSALNVSCRQLGSVGVAREPPKRAKCQPGSAPVSSRPVLAMQKVDGSSPFIRLGTKPKSGVLRLRIVPLKCHKRFVVVATESSSTVHGRASNRLVQKRSTT